MKHFLFLLSFLFLFSSCTPTTSSLTSAPPSSFADFTDSLFVDFVQTDTLNLHYKLSSPSTYNITPSQITLGNLSPSALEAEFTKMEDALATLYTFNYHLLSSSDQFTYDILEDYLTSNLKLEPFLLYREPLGATLGIQSQLPILLSEYTFSSEEDIQTYLLLLEDVDNYFLSILEFEQAKKEAGLFMENCCLEEIIKQCESFIQSNLLIETFHERLDSLSLSEEKKQLYTIQNQNLVETVVLPAYQMLADGLHNFVNSSKYTGGLCNKPEGKEYYELLVYQKTGSSKTVSELFSQTKQRIAQNVLSIATLCQKDESLSKQLSNYQFSHSDPNSTLSYLQNAIQSDFPTPVSNEFLIKYVSDSLSEFTSPAFYIIPPIDDSSRNIIYINTTSEKLFPILAHEGFPGHLYQHTWFSQMNDVPLRELLSYLGYTEGWATYCELYSYTLEDNFSESLKELLLKTQETTLAIYSLMDMGIHYYGWTLEEIKQTLSTYFGFTDSNIAESIYTSLLESPANYLSYYVGYTELLELKNYAQKKWGDDFSLMNFHTQILNLGPAPFDLIKNKL